MNEQALLEEFDRQVSALITKHYPLLAGVSEDTFLADILSLKPHVKKLTVQGPDMSEGYLPFVIVIKSTLVPTEKAMAAIEKNGYAGVTKLTPLVPADFQVIESEDIPEGNAYLLVDIDRGKASLNMRPHDAKDLLKKQLRHPLTIDEGVALVTQFPDFLMKNNCFSLLASRNPVDKRVPAIWINGAKHPHLGWCWDGNPHTWLGSASALSRVGAD